MGEATTRLDALGGQLTTPGSGLKIQKQAAHSGHLSKEGGGGSKLKNKLRFDGYGLTGSDEHISSETSV
jgi:hypothetical protein